jgi:hypothetical protein
MSCVSHCDHQPPDPLWVSALDQAPPHEEQDDKERSIAKLALTSGVDPIRDQDVLSKEVEERYKRSAL